MVNGGQNTISGKLTADIDLSTVCSATKGSWTPIGNSSFIFNGTFDGDGHTISNLYINAISDYQGLFGCAKGTECVIKNVTVKGKIISTYSRVGGIVGLFEESDGGTIDNCVNECSIKGSNYVGGIVGYLMSTARIINCTNNGSITGTQEWTGGIVGLFNGTGSVSRCMNTGTVTNIYTTNVGGIVGQVNGNGTITESINTGAIVGSGSTGGICGFLFLGTISNCLNMANDISSVKGLMGSAVIPANAGAIVGVDNKNTISNCHYLNTVVITEDGNQVTAIGVRAKGRNNNSTKNTGDTDGETTGQGTMKMASGGVAYLLGNNAFGEMIGTDAIPTFLAADGSNKVLNATIYYGSATSISNNYINPNQKPSNNAVAVAEDILDSIDMLSANIIVKDTDGSYKAKAISLVGSEPFYTPCDFTAVSADFTPTIKAGECVKSPVRASTLTIVPFNGVVMCDGSTAGLEYNHNFWVKYYSEFNSSNKVVLSDVLNVNIPANTPYLAGAINTESGADFSKQVMTIHGDNVLVSINSVDELRSDELNIHGTYAGKQVENSYVLDPTRSKLVSVESATIQPFGVYFSAIGISSPYLEFEESGTTGAHAINGDKLLVWAGDKQIVILAPSAQNIKVYNMNGLLVKDIDEEAGKTIIDELVEGCYIVNGTKVVIR